MTNKVFAPIIIILISITYLVYSFISGYNREAKNVTEYKNLATATLTELSTSSGKTLPIDSFCAYVLNDYLMQDPSINLVLAITPNTLDKYDVSSICKDTIIGKEVYDYSLTKFKTTLKNISQINYSIIDYIRFGSSDSSFNTLGWIYLCIGIGGILLLVKNSHKSYKYIKTSEINEIRDSQPKILKRIYKTVLVGFPAIAAVTILLRASSDSMLSSFYIFNMYLPLAISIALIPFCWRKIDRFKFAAKLELPKQYTNTEYINESEYIELIKKTSNQKENLKLMLYGFSTMLFLSIWIIVSSIILLISIS
jgi:hypothetical protein